MREPQYLLPAFALIPPENRIETAPLSPPPQQSPQQPLQSPIALFVSLMRQHQFDLQLRTNVLNGRTEILSEEENGWRALTSDDVAGLRLFFESRYGLRNANALNDAISCLCKQNRVNPAINIIESHIWDDEPRLEHFLSFAMGCEDTPYTREVSRLIFAEGIYRAYEPGCKCDYMPVLVGPQGCGKSTLVRWLNLNDELFGEVRTINGKEGYEAVSGVWIGEVPELMAVTHAKDVESVKAFISAREDHYRPPYEKNVRSIPRRCVLIGTTNNPSFLTDLTGNRRFLPVVCHTTGEELFRRKTEIRVYIRRCWAEARKRYLEDRLPTYPDPALLEEISTQQQEAMEEDWRVGLVADYMARKPVGDTVCVLELWHKALGMDPTRKPTRKDSLEISQMIRSVPGWSYASQPTRGSFGMQRYATKRLGLTLKDGLTPPADSAS